jgi:hypothetical protein
VTYQSGSSYYHVTYTPSGAYTYVINHVPNAAAGAPSQNTTLPSSAGPTVAGSYSTMPNTAPGSASYNAPSTSPATGMGGTAASPNVLGSYSSPSYSAGGAGTGTLPTTGGANPSSPTLPALPLGIAGLMIAAGLATRRFALARIQR